MDSSSMCGANPKVLRRLLNSQSYSPYHILMLLYPHTAWIGHQCRYPGCNTVLVIDGNLKNRRAVCAATEAGYLQYPGLSGSIKSGCQMTPMQTSKYCYHHATRVSKLMPPSEVFQESLGYGTSQSTKEVSGKEGIIKFILSKKQTRNEVYYQVSVFCQTCTSACIKKACLRINSCDADILYLMLICCNLALYKCINISVIY